MITQLAVVNKCLAIMGESPLNSLAEEHEFKQSALTILDAVKRRILAKRGTGWWFNAESLTLTVSPADSRIYLPADAIGTITFSDRPNLAKRGRVLYDLENGTDRFDAGTVLKSKLIRNLAIEDVPETVAALIAETVVLEFQSDYDGDQTKTRNLMLAIKDLWVDAEGEHARNRKVNLLDSNPRLARIRNIYRQLR